MPITLFARTPARQTASRRARLSWLCRGAVRRPAIPPAHDRFFGCIRPVVMPLNIPAAMFTVPSGVGRG